MHDRTKWGDNPDDAARRMIEAEKTANGAARGITFRSRITRYIDETKAELAQLAQSKDKAFATLRMIEDGEHHRRGRLEGLERFLSYLREEETNEEIFVEFGADQVAQAGDRESGAGSGRVDEASQGPVGEQ